MCAIFGLIDYRNRFSAAQREYILRILSTNCQVRGTDATGFAFNKNTRLTVYKRPHKASAMLLALSDEANIIHGHTRMTTQGSERFNFNNHPFRGNVGNTEFALAHNGVIYNDLALRAELQLPETEIQTDSYIAVQLLENSRELDENSLKNMAEKIEGSFVFTVLDSKNNSYFVRGSNLLALYHYAKFGFYIYASTKQILEKSLTEIGALKYPHEEIETNMGDILKIDSAGKLTRSHFEAEPEYAFYGNWQFDSCYDRSLESTYILELKEFANTVGVYPEDVELLLDFGYSTDEIEDMLYDTDLLHAVLSEIFGCCGEV